MRLLGTSSFFFGFSNPPVYSRNTFNERIVDELIDVFDLCDKDDRVRVVILTSEPTAPAYCSGVRTVLFPPECGQHDPTHSFPFQADISKGWDLLWKEESEKEGEHGEFQPHSRYPRRLLIL